MQEGPSIACVVAPYDPDTTLERCHAALLREGYAPRTTALPPTYRAAQGEWLGLAIYALPGPRPGATSVIVPTDVSQVFQFAMWLSRAFPDDILAGFRRLSGFEPVAKIVFAGKPQWKDGRDPDHEVYFDVPTSRPAEVRLPSPARIPLTAFELGVVLLGHLRPVRGPSDAPVGARWGAWLHRTSYLAKM
jgi:hypothetical protein